MLSFDTGGEGGLELLVPVDRDGVYDITLYLVRAPDFGVVRLAVNGNPAGGPMDAFLKTDDLTRPIWPPKGFVVPGVRLKKGLNTFRFELKEKNPESEGFKMGIDCLVLTEKGGAVSD
jgi:hypothetical protein